MTTELLDLNDLASLLGRQGEVEAAQEALANARLQSPDFVARFQIESS